MTHFSAWAFAWAIGLCAAAVAAWMISSAPNQPAATREPIRVQLACLQPGSYQLPEPRTWATLPEIPPHVLKRSEPLWGDETELVRGHVRHVASVRKAVA